MSIPYLPTPASGLARFFKNDFVVAALIAVALSGTTFALAYSLGWLTGAPNWFEVAGATINYGATYLSIKQRRFAYTLGFLASGAFAVAYYQYELLGSALLSAYLVGQLVYGYFRWGPDGKTRPVHTFQWKWAWAYALATVATYLGAVGIVTLFGGRFAFWDAAILILTILAQFLLDNKVLASWFVWCAVNIIGVTLYFTADAPFAAVQQLIFLFANIPGYILWRKSMQAVEDSAALVDALDPRNSGKFDTELLVQQIKSTTEGLYATVEVPKDSMAEKHLKKLTGDLKSLSVYHYEFTHSERFILQTGNVPVIKDKKEDDK